MGQSPETCTLIPVVVPTRITASYLSSHKFNPRGAGHSNQSSLAQWQGSPMTQAAPWRKHRFKYGGRGKQWKTPMNQFSPSVNLSRNLNRRRSTKRCAGFRSAHSCTCFHPLSQWSKAPFSTMGSCRRRASAGSTGNDLVMWCHVSLNQTWGPLPHTNWDVSAIRGFLLFNWEKYHSSLGYPLVN